MGYITGTEEIMRRLTIWWLAKPDGQDTIVDFCATYVTTYYNIVEFERNARLTLTPQRCTHPEAGEVRVTIVEKQTAPPQLLGPGTREQIT